MYILVKSDQLSTPFSLPWLIGHFPVAYRWELGEWKERNANTAPPAL